MIWLQLSKVQLTLLFCLVVRCAQVDFWGQVGKLKWQKETSLDHYRKMGQERKWTSKSKQSQKRQLVMSGNSQLWRTNLFFSFHSKYKTMGRLEWSLKVGHRCCWWPVCSTQPLLIRLSALPAQMVLRGHRRKCMTSNPGAPGFETRLYTSPHCVNGQHWWKKLLVCMQSKTQTHVYQGTQTDASFLFWCKAKKMHCKRNKQM